MRKEGKILRNSTFSLVYQVLNSIIQFVIRSLIIKCIGVELLGIGSTFNSILGALSLADLGFQTAIVFRLYKPIQENNRETIIDLLNVFKYIYICVGVFFLIAGIITLKFIPYLTKGIEINDSVYFIFVLEMLAPAMTYFLSYKRSLLYADQREYISQIIDSSILVLFSIFKIIVIIIYKNFYIYLFLQIIQNICSNLLIYLYCKKMYSTLEKSRPLQKDIFKLILSDTKDVFFGKLSGYIYSSTDNLVISSFINTITVGYFVNYTMITKQISLLVNSILNPVAPFVGGMLAKEENNEKQVSFFELYSFIRFVIACIIVIPTILLLQDFIEIWLGDEYLLKWEIPFLLGVDMFISIVYAACYDFNNGSGLFKKEKNVMFIGAMMNISISILLTKSLGVTGVLVGTVITQVFFWISRSYIAIKYSLKQNRQYFFKYCLQSLVYVLFFLGSFLLCLFLLSKLNIMNKYICFLVKGLITEIILMVMLLIIFKNNKNVKHLVNYIRKSKQ